MASQLLTGLSRVGPKRLVTYLARLVPKEPESFLVSFDLTSDSYSEFRGVEDAVRVLGGLVVNRQPLGPSPWLVNWTVKFFSDEKARELLGRCGLLSATRTVESYKVKR